MRSGSKDKGWKIGISGLLAICLLISTACSREDSIFQRGESSSSAESSSSESSLSSQPSSSGETSQSQSMPQSSSEIPPTGQSASKEIPTSSPVTSDSPETTRPVQTTVRTPVASGVESYSSSVATIDASNSAKGYVMVNYTGSNSKPVLQLTGPDSVTYTYYLHGGWETFPLTAGSGNYALNIFENVSGTSYAYAMSQSISASLANSFEPYLTPNQYVNYNSNSQTVAKGAQLAQGAANELEVIARVYNYCVGNISYDYDKAAKAQSGQLAGYTPVVDSILASGTGICFDYAAVMATMLRTQNIPTRMEIGYVTGGTYHAWVSVYTEESGWINGIIQFDGQKWKLMDPTFASNGNSSESIMSFIGNTGNYSTNFRY